MNLLVAILFALKINVDPAWTERDLKAKDPINYDRAVKIRDNNQYKIGSNGVIIIDETGGKN